MIADALDDDGRPAVADAETLAGHTANVTFTARRAVEGHVADDDVLLRLERGERRRIDDQAPARQSLAKAVIRIARRASSSSRQGRTRRSSDLPSR